jgi:leucyl aminopeptidase
LEIRVVSGDITQQPADAIIVNLFEGVRLPGGATGAVDRALQGKLSSLIGEGECTGAFNEMTLLDTSGLLPARSVVVAGLGKSDVFDLARVRAVTAATVRFANEHGFKNAATIVHGAGIGGLSAKEAAQALAEGALAEAGRLERKDIEELLIVEFDARKLPELEQGVRNATASP